MPIGIETLPFSAEVPAPFAFNRTVVGANHRNLPTKLHRLI